MLLPNVEHWSELAACAEVDPELFFPRSDSERAQVADAKKVCRGCSVKFECLNYAMKEQIEFGIFGGLTESERWKMGKVRRVS